jgi:hypothetical protein
MIRDRQSGMNHVQGTSRITAWQRIGVDIVLISYRLSPICFLLHIIRPIIKPSWYSMQQCGTVILVNDNHRSLPSSHPVSHKKSNISLFPKYDSPLPSFLPVSHFSCMCERTGTVSTWRSL